MLPCQKPRCFHDTYPKNMALLWFKLKNNNMVILKYIIKKNGITMKHTTVQKFDFNLAKDTLN